ncbi:DsbA family protein [Clostridium sp. Ade.TY]|uniref:DsbA family protein n=1 Tax=Clostridium sp. Ade.TY TaxID=1391647 RepID=UPI000407000E|nr:DsbA family protein [Clostridium sp. Ade.TY]
MEKYYEIIYVYDGLCSWCYGFDDVINEAYEKFKDKFNFKIVSGGMFTGEAMVPVKMILKEHYKEGYNRIFEVTGAKITEAYLELIRKENYKLNSEKTARALSAFRTYGFKKEDEFKFIKKLQNQIFFEGLNPNYDEFYKSLAQYFNINENEFLSKMKEKSVIEDSIKDFEYAKMLKVNSFPQVLIKENEKKYYLAAKGYTDLNTLMQRINNIVNEIESNK